MGKDHPQGPDLCGNHQENSWSWALLPPILCHSSRLARAESTTWNGHSPYRQPQPQTVYCYLKLTPSMLSLMVLDDCRVTVKAYVRDFSGHLLVRNLLVVFSWPYVEPERVTVRSLIMQAHAGSQVAQWMWNREKSQARCVGGKGREDHQLHSSEAKHCTLALLVHWPALSWSSPTEWFSLVTQHPYQQLHVLISDHSVEPPQVPHHIRPRGWMPVMQKWC